MGTNYYAIKAKPSIQKPIHIGKYSGGWKFLFAANNDKWNEPPIVWNTYNQVMKWLYENIEVKGDYVIHDEYDEYIPLNKFIELVEEAQNNENPDNFDNCRNVDGYRFVDGDFW